MRSCSGRADFVGHCLRAVVTSASMLQKQIRAVIDHLNQGSGVLNSMGRDDLTQTIRQWSKGNSDVVASGHSGATSLALRILTAHCSRDGSA